MAEAADTLRAQQFALSKHLRDPQAVAAPDGIEDRRLAVYRDLLRNNIRTLLSGNFPVIRKTLGDDGWERLVRAFFAGHRSRTPLFTEIGREFIRFVEDRADAGAGDPPWLPELAHYEWVELALQISDAPPPDGIDAMRDPGAQPRRALLDGIPIVSPLAWALAYRWPVHRIGPGYMPDAPPDAPTLVLVRRDDAGDVRFAQLSPLVYRLLELLSDGESRSGRETLLALAGETGVADADGFLVEGAAMLQRMLDEGTILGVRRR